MVHPELIKDTKARIQDFIVRPSVHEYHHHGTADQRWEADVICRLTAVNIGIVRNTPTFGIEDLDVYGSSPCISPPHPLS
jgi:hypothetical protein